VPLTSALPSSTPLCSPALGLSCYAGPARYSAGYYLEKKVSWWWRIAEMRRPLPASDEAAHSPAVVTVPAQAKEPDDAPARDHAAA
jgi:hypothetical protein